MYRYAKNVYSLSENKPGKPNSLFDMKKILIVLIILAPVITSVSQVVDVVSGATLKPEYLKQYLADPDIRAVYNNDNFDNQPAVKLSGTMPELGGEILNPGKASFEGCDLRTVYVKELLPGERGEEPSFHGAFRYSGYSLADLVKDLVVDKKNKAEFGLSLDLFVVVENGRGESAVFSWGELFFSKRGQDIILATGVTPVFPTASDDRWEVPATYRLISANDFLTVRNISGPTRITIRSFPVSFPGEKGTRPLFAPELTFNRGNKSFKVNDFAGSEPSLNLQTVFFGLHKGLRHIATFSGISLGEVLQKSTVITPDDLDTGILAIGAKDGYRVLYSLSEIMNRTDLEAVLLMDRGESEDGRYSIFPAADFFADRHLKGAMTGYILDATK